MAISGDRGEEQCRIPQRSAYGVRCQRKFRRAGPARGIRRERRRGLKKGLRVYAGLHEPGEVCFIRSTGIGDRGGRAPSLFRCPITGSDVQGILVEEAPSVDPNSFTPVCCLECGYGVISATWRLATSDTDIGKGCSSPSRDRTDRRTSLQIRPLSEQSTALRWPDRCVTAGRTSEFWLLPQGGGRKQGNYRPAPGLSGSHTVSIR
jgi:hypothetical protein